MLVTEDTDDVRDTMLETIADVIVVERTAW